MASIFYANDQGEVIVEAGKVWNRVGQVLGAVTDDLPDYGNVGDFTYNTADDQGLTYYTKQQRAVSRYLYGGGPVNVTARSETLIFTTPAAGVLRIYGTSTSLRWYINGVSQGIPPNSGEANSAFINLQPGDELSYSNGAVVASLYFRFLPFVYPVV